MRSRPQKPTLLASAPITSKLPHFASSNQRVGPEITHHETLGSRSHHHPLSLARRGVGAGGRQGKLTAPAPQGCFLTSYAFIITIFFFSPFSSDQARHRSTFSTPSLTSTSPLRSASPCFRFLPCPPRAMITIPSTGEAHG